MIVTPCTQKFVYNTAASSSVFRRPDKEGGDRERERESKRERQRESE